MNKLKLIIQKAIINKSLVEFFYTDKSKPNAAKRKIEPLLFGVNDTGVYYLSGYDLLNMTGNPEKDQKNYYLTGIDAKSFKVLREKYAQLRIHPNKLYRTKKEGTTVICVADFPEHITRYYEH
jgi:hypothetical protein